VIKISGNPEMQFFCMMLLRLVLRFLSRGYALEVPPPRDPQVLALMSMMT